MLGILIHQSEHSVPHCLIA